MSMIYVLVSITCVGEHNICVDEHNMCVGEYDMCRWA